MSDQVRAGAGTARLERGYRRILACYPRSFRAASADEVLAVLLDAAAEGQARVGLAEVWDLVRGGLRMRLWPAAPRPRSVRAAVTLMLAGAAAELAVLVTVLLTAGSVRMALAARYPAAVHAMTAHVIIDMAAAPLVIGVWLWLAWANGQGRDWARPLSAVSFLVLSVSMMALLTQHAPVFAPADVIAAAAEWVLGLASVILIFTPAAGRYYQLELARQ